MRMRRHNYYPPTPVLTTLDSPCVGVQCLSAKAHTPNPAVHHAMGAGASSWTARDMPSSIEGQIVVVTGGNAGLGFQLCNFLAQAGAIVVMAGRSEARLANARSRITAGTVHTMVVDLASLRSIHEFAANFTRRFGRVDIVRAQRRATPRDARGLRHTHPNTPAQLINNAGVMLTPDLTRTEDGLELQVGVNHFGAFALTGALLPALKASSLDPAVDTRVVNVSSMLHRTNQAAAGVDWDNLNAEKKYDAADAYSVSKLCNLLFTAGFNAWAEERSLGVKAVTAHPGFSATNLTQHMACGACLRCCFASPPSEGCLSILRAATDPDVQAGEFYGPRGSCGGGEREGPPELCVPSAAAQNKLDAVRLWDVSMHLTNVNFDEQLAQALPDAAGGVAESKAPRT